jgi:hypothetical protein
MAYVHSVHAVVGAAVGAAVAAAPNSLSTLMKVPGSGFTQNEMVLKTGTDSALA